VNNCSTQKTLFEEQGDKLVVNAPAKLNLYLLIAGKREDGYHSINTLMSKITWYDRIEIEPSDKKGVSLRCIGDFWAPENDDNLVIKAAVAFSRARGFEPSVNITLIKNIPAGTGLGSASSCAGATLLGLDKFYSLNTPAWQLAEIAATFGSDTAFFTGSAQAVCSGRGEIITGIDKEVDFRALVVVPPISVSTASVYKNYLHDDAYYRKSFEQISTLVNQGQRENAALLGINMLTESCFKTSVKMRQIHQILNDILGGATLSGSGSAFYKILKDESQPQIEEYMRCIEDRLGCNVILVSNNRW